jgi:hypothetical protein
MIRTVVAALVLAIAVAGCGGKKDNTLAPTRTSAITVPGATLETVQTANGPVRAWVTSSRNGTHLQRVLYICDYPMGYYGPPSPGHCYEDGSGCTGPAIGDDPLGGYTAPPAPTAVDPTGDDSKPLSGDPTADD